MTKFPKGFKHLKTIKVKQGSKDFLEYDSTQLKFICIHSDSDLRFVYQIKLSYLASIIRKRAFLSSCFVLTQQAMYFCLPVNQ